MKQKLILLLFALLSTMGVWADTYTITYNVGAGGSFNAGSGWCSTWTSTGSPTVTIQSSGNGFNSGNGNLAQQIFTISVESGYIITGFKISTVNGWGSLVTAESGEKETFSGEVEKTFSVGANATSTYFTVSASNFNKPVIAVYIEDLVNYASSVIANVKPHFDNANRYFCLTSAALAAYQSDYDTYSVNCTEDQYTTLLTNVRDLYSDPKNYVQPTTGFYRIKSSGARNIGESYIGYGSSDYGTGLRTVAAANKLTDISTVIKFTGSNGTYKLSTQGLNVQSQTTANRAFPVTSDEGVDFVFNVIPNKPGFVTICNTASVNGNCHGYLHEGGDGTSAKGVVNWQSGATASHWTVEAATSFDVTLNSGGDGMYYATLYLPFDVTMSEACAYTLTLNGDKNGLTLSAAFSEVPAGTPVLLRHSTNTLTATVNNGEAFNSGSPLVCDLTGSYTGLTLSQSDDKTIDYVLGVVDDEIGFYHWAGTALSPNRAYFEASKLPADVKGLALLFDDATKIESVHKVQGSRIYNLAGQMVNGNLPKGIYINNGKKVFIK